MNFVFDLAVLAFLALFTWWGVSKGFIRGVLEFLGSLVSAVLASWLGGWAAELVYNQFLREGLCLRVEKVVSRAGSLPPARLFFDQLPDFIRRLLEMRGITAETAEKAAAGAGSKTAEILTDLISPVLIGMIKVFAVIVLFLLFMVIIRAVAGMLNRVFHLPVLRQVNGAVGGICGFLFGVVILWIVISAVQFFEPMMSPELQRQFRGTVEDSIACQCLFTVNPLQWIFE